MPRRRQFCVVKVKRLEPVNAPKRGAKENSTQDEM